MGKKKLTGVLLLLAAGLVVIGCNATGTPVMNVTDAPVAADKPVTVEDVGKAITRAGLQLGWQIKADAPGHITATLLVRGHVAVVDITYSAKTYSIKYKDSQNLNYDGTNIHRNYNGWVANLDRGIRTQLATW